MKKIVFPFVLFIVCSFSVAAQKLSVATDQPAIVGMMKSLSAKHAIFKDADTNVFYIDFQKVSFHITEVIVIDANKAMVKKLDTHTLPIDTIFDLDLTSLPAGAYTLVLHSAAHELTHEVTLQ